MTTTSHSPKDELLGNLLAVAEACPLAECNPKDCPLYLLRKMEGPRRLKWLTALNEKDLAYLVTYHHVCLNTRVAF